MKSTHRVTEASQVSGSSEFLSSPGNRYRIGCKQLGALVEGEKGCRV